MAKSKHGVESLKYKNVDPCRAAASDMLAAAFFGRSIGVWSAYSPAPALPAARLCNTYTGRYRTMKLVGDGLAACREAIEKEGGWITYGDAEPEATASDPAGTAA